MKYIPYQHALSVRYKKATEIKNKLQTISILSRTLQTAQYNKLYYAYMTTQFYVNCLFICLWSFCNLEF